MARDDAGGSFKYGDFLLFYALKLSLGNVLCTQDTSYDLATCPKKRGKQICPSIWKVYMTYVMNSGQS